MSEDFYQAFNDGIINMNSLLKPCNSYNIYKEIQEVKDLSGSTAEVGVFQGRTSRLIHKLMPNKRHYAYDTFCGIVGSDPLCDVYTDGNFSAGLDMVKSIINMDNVVYRVGFFPDSFKEYDEQFCFVHSDTDTYIGTKSTLDYFCKRLVSGGKIVFDDYLFDKCPGVEKALMEFKKTDTKFIHKEIINPPVIKEQIHHRTGIINEYHTTNQYCIIKI